MSTAPACAQNPAAISRERSMGSRTAGSGTNATVLTTTASSTTVRGRSGGSATPPPYLREAEEGQAPHGRLRAMRLERGQVRPPPDHPGRAVHRGEHHDPLPQLSPRGDRDGAATGRVRRPWP